MGMKLLLTSSGLTNESIRKALVDLLGKPFTQARAIYVPTAMYAVPGASSYAWEVLKEHSELGWSAFGVLELTALPTLLPEHWLPTLQEADVLVVGGGNTPYLSYWMHSSGLAEQLRELLQRIVYVGISAGSMIVTQSMHVNRETLETTGVYADDDYDDVAPPHAGSDKTLKLVDFTLRPHLGTTYFPKITLDRMERAAAEVEAPMYVIDDQTALKVINGAVEVVSEGTWKLFEK
jgi:dipeptidase E